MMHIIYMIYKVLKLLKNPKHIIPELDSNDKLLFYSVKQEPRIAVTNILVVLFVKFALLIVISIQNMMAIQIVGLALLALYMIF